MADEKLPEHLHGLQDQINKTHSFAPDDAKYAEIAFALIEAAEGDKGAIAKISGYIQNQHRELKHKHETIESTKSRVKSWLMWAENWTEGKKP